MVNVAVQPSPLIGVEVMAVPAHQAKQTPVPRAGRIEVAPRSKEMVIDEADDVETIRHDPCIGKALRRRGEEADHSEARDFEAPVGYRICRSSSRNRGVPIPGGDLFVSRCDARGGSSTPA